MHHANQIPEGGGESRAISAQYGGEYTDILLSRIRVGVDTDLERAKAVADQEEIFTKLKAVLAARLMPCPLSAIDELKFDSKVDDTELLLRLFWELDLDHQGTISKEELFGSPLLQKAENADMAKVLHRSWMCGIEVLADALAHLDGADFGNFRRNTTANSDSVFDRSASVLAVFAGAAVPTFIPAGSGSFSTATIASMSTTGAGTEEKMITRAGIERLLEKSIRDFAELKQEDESGIEFEGKLELALTALAQDLLPENKELDFLAFKKVTRRLPRVAGHRISWVSDLGIATSLARHLPPGTFDDGLEGIKHMDEASAQRALDAFFADMRRIFMDAVNETKQEKGSTSAAAANSKFEGFQGSFASLKDFHAGAEDTLQLGYPNPDIEKGIRLEHTAHISTTRLFVTPNYRIATCLLVEYWWAIYEDEPSDSVVKSLQGDAIRLIRKLHSDRGDHWINTGADRVEDAKLVFPGEVGDSFVETLVVVKMKAAAKTCMQAVQKAAEKILESEEEKVRWYRTLDQAACLDWTTASSRIISQLAPAASEAVLEDADIISVGVVLPMSKARAEARCAALRSEVMVTLQGDEAVSVAVSVVSEKAWFFSSLTDIKELRKHMGDMSLFELKEWARTKWCVSYADTTTELLSAEIVASFVRNELQNDFRIALANAHSSQIIAVLQAWNLPPGGSRQEQTDRACQALTSEKRWKEVESWVGLFCGRIQGRTRLGLKGLMLREKTKVKNYGLVAGEVLALYLYTGPEFVPMNEICRNFPQNILNLLLGDSATPRNTLCTTLFCITSGIKKLGRYTDLPEDRKVYRGLGRMLLPPQFWVPYGTPAWRGGVERAFMSTTADKSVAMFYANGRGTVVEISVGRIQIGGDVSFLSMYPGEKEITFPPFTCLESNGDPRLERLDGGEIIIFPLQASVNPKAETVEELQRRRKGLHLGMCKLLREDLSIMAEQRATVNDQQGQPRFVHLKARINNIKDRIKCDFNKLVEQHECQATSEFNKDDVYKCLMSEAIDGKAYALLKMDIYIESLEDSFDERALSRIFDSPIKSFGSPAIVLELRTDIVGFPWKKIVEDKSAAVDIGGWNAEGVAPKAIEYVCNALRSNANLRSVDAASVKLDLKEGWSTTAIDWKSKEAVTLLPATAALLLRNCTYVTNLNISDNRIGASGSKAIFPTLATLISIQILDLSENNIGHDGSPALCSALHSLTDLQALDLRGNNLGVSGWSEVMNALESCSELYSLNDLKDFRRLLGAEGSLRTLDVRGHDVGGKELAAALAHYLPRSSSTLTSLNVSGNGINAAAMELLSPGLARLSALESLDLYSNEITGNGGAALAGTALPHLASLKELVLGRCALHADGAKELGAALPHLTNLTVLALGWNGIGNDGCHALLPSLTCMAALKLHLQTSDGARCGRGNGIDQQTQAAAREALSRLVSIFFA